MTDLPPYKTTLRDRIATRLANLCMRLATPRYRAMIAGFHEYGLRAAARDSTQGLDAPGDWRDPDTRARWAHGEDYR